MQTPQENKQKAELNKSILSSACGRSEQCLSGLDHMSASDPRRIRDLYISNNLPVLRGLKKDSVNHIIPCTTPASP